MTPLRVPAGDMTLTMFPHRPAGPPRGVVLLAHAMFAHSAYLRALAEALAAAGFVAVRLDLRGHGQSGPLPPEGRWDFDDLVQLDHPAAVAALRDAFPGRPLWLVGHSLGGKSGLAAEVRRGPLYDGILILASGLWLHPGVTGVRRLFRRGVMELSALVARAFGRLPMASIGWGSDESIGFWLQYVSWVRRQRWDDAAGRPYLDGVESLRLPVIALRGTRDTTVHDDDHRALVCMPQARFVAVEGADHMSVAHRGVAQIVALLSAAMPAQSSPTST